MLARSLVLPDRDGTFRGSSLVIWPCRVRSYLHEDGDFNERAKGSVGPSMQVFTEV
jgi:hypothetical protein